MRIILEVLRFMLLYFLLTTVIGGLIVILTDPILIQFGLDSDNYIWMGIILAIPVILAIYKKKEWGNVFDRKILWTSIAAIVLLLATTPALSSENIYSSRYAVSYGFPFEFITLYVEGRSTFLLPSIFSGNVTSVAMNAVVFFNFLILYFIFYLLFLLIDKIKRSKDKPVIN